MPSPVTNDTKQPVQISGPAPAPATSEIPTVTDNLNVQAGLVIDPNSNSKTLSKESTEEIPSLESPENFETKKKVVNEEKTLNLLDLLFAQAKANLNSRKESIDSRQKNLSRMQEAQKENAKDMDKKVDEQMDKQAKSNSKSGFMSIFNKVFAGITALIGLAMIIIVPGMQAVGALMLVGAAISLATQIPGVMEGLGKMFTAILTPFIGKEAAEKWGPIVASVYVAVVQIALAVATWNVASAGQSLGAMAAVLRFASTAAQTTQGVVQGGVGIALGVNNIDLAKITKEVDFLSSFNDFANTQVQQYIQAINQNYQEMSRDLRRSLQTINEIPTIQIA